MMCFLVFALENKFVVFYNWERMLLPSQLFHVKHSEAVFIRYVCGFFVTGGNALGYIISLIARKKLAEKMCA